jgi:hypothetical protein
VISQGDKKKKEKRKREMRKRKDDRTLSRSDLNLSNLILGIQCKWTGKVVLEWTETNWQSQGGLWIHPSTFVLAEK